MRTVIAVVLALVVGVSVGMAQREWPHEMWSPESPQVMTVRFFDIGTPEANDYMSSAPADAYIAVSGPCPSGWQPLLHPAAGHVYVPMGAMVARNGDSLRPPGMVVRACERIPGPRI